MLCEFVAWQMTTDGEGVADAVGTPSMNIAAIRERAVASASEARLRLVVVDKLIAPEQQSRRHLRRRGERMGMIQEYHRL